MVKLKQHSSDLANALMETIVINNLFMPNYIRDRPKTKLALRQLHVAIWGDSISVWWNTQEDCWLFVSCSEMVFEG